MANRTQLRGVCPACFATQALNGNALVQHGYRRPQHWHQNVGTCTGTGQPHFGTAAGRDYTAFVAKKLRNGADVNDHVATQVLDGTDHPVLTLKRVAYGVNSEVVVDNPTSTQRATYAARLRQRANMMRDQAAELEQLAAAWKPVEPVAVEVEKKASPVHFAVSFYGHRHHACASSAMGARQYRVTTTEVEKVTCERCKMRKAFVNASRG